MANDDRIKLIPRRTPESAAMVENVRRAMAITAILNRLTFDDTDEIRAVFSDLIGKKVDDGFILIPPFYTTGGADILIGQNVFINQNCTIYDLGGVDIGFQMHRIRAHAHAGGHLVHLNPGQIIGHDLHALLHHWLADIELDRKSTR